MDELSDHEQFLRLFLQHQPQIYGYLRTMIFNRADAEEVLQDVATVLWRKFDQFEPGTRFDQWAYRVAHNQVLYYRQKKQRDVLVFQGELLETIAGQTIAENEHLGERGDALEECLQKLPSCDRELIRQRFQPGETNRSVARAAGRSESTISRTLDRIYAALLQCVQTRLGW